MTKRKYTPGPWITDGMGYIYSELDIADDGYIPKETEPVAIICLRPELKANIDIIAAAPDMYEALNNYFKFPENKRGKAIIAMSKALAKAEEKS